MPDCGKLTALADALGVSLDKLCGRAEPVPAADSAAPRKGTWRLPALLCAAVLLAAAAFWMGARYQAGRAMPETVAAYDKEFSYTETGEVAFRFTPSVARRGYSYEVTFTRLPDTDGAGGDMPSLTVSVDLRDGVCSGSAALEQNARYAVTLTVRSRDETRRVGIANITLDGGELYVYAAL